MALVEQEMKGFREVFKVYASALLEITETEA